MRSGGTIRAASAIGGVLFAFGIAASPAGAAVTIGSNLIGDATASFGCGSCTVSDTSLDPAYTAPGGFLAPSDGVVVRWRVKAGTNVSPMALRITRPGNSTTRTGAGTSATETPAANSTTPFETRFPIQAGDAIGLDCCSTGQTHIFATATGASGIAWTPRLQDGETPRAGLSLFDYEVLINADIEPDADADGFGDETQDQCAGETGPDNGCPAPADTAPPDTTITSGPKKKTTKKPATIEFTGTDARAIASFQCKLDAAAFAPCTSPYTVKVKKGKHTVQVQAIDQAGNVDSTPATHSWKVRKKKKRPG